MAMMIAYWIKKRMSDRLQRRWQESFNFLEAEVAAMEVDFEQGEIDKEVQAWQIAEAIQKGNLAPIEAFLQAGN